jgi:hypothetical protein
MSPQEYVGQRLDIRRAEWELQGGVGVNLARWGLFDNVQPGTVSLPACYLGALFLVPRRPVPGSGILLTLHLALAQPGSDNPCFAILRKVRPCWTV